MLIGNASVTDRECRMIRANLRVKWCKERHILNARTARTNLDF